MIIVFLSFITNYHKSQGEEVALESKEKTWWIGRRENAYVGVFCNRPTIEVNSPRHAAQVQVIISLIVYFS